VSADEVYGGNHGLRKWWRRRRSARLAVACDEMIAVTADGGRADALAALGASGRVAAADMRDVSKGRGCMDGR